MSGCCAGATLSGCCADWRVPLPGFAGALTGTRHDAGAAPPVVSGTNLFPTDVAGATGGQITFGVPTDLAEQIPGVPTHGIEETVPTDVAELCHVRGAVTGGQG